MTLGQKHMHSVIFLDKDGTLMEDVPFNVDPARIRWMPGAREGLQHLACRGYSFAVVSNQAGVALGRFAEEALEQVGHALEALMAECGAPFLGFYYCPHHPDGTVIGYSGACGCRKPMPGLLRQVFRDHHVDAAASWMVGDILDDVEAGNRAGLRSLLVDNGHETCWHAGPWRVPEGKVKDLIAAAEYIARGERGIRHGGSTMAGMP